MIHTARRRWSGGRNDEVSIKQIAAEVVIDYHSIARYSLIAERFGNCMKMVGHDGISQKKEEIILCYY